MARRYRTNLWTQARLSFKARGDSEIAEDFGIAGRELRGHQYPTDSTRPLLCGAADQIERSRATWITH
jgi:hypothetical protein